jgi:hypothetical protein
MEGGTPGRINSVHSSDILRRSGGVVESRSAGKVIEIEFSDPILIPVTAEKFNIPGNSIARLRWDESRAGHIFLETEKPFDPGTPYTLIINDLPDCSESYFIDTTLLTGIGITPRYLDVIITEVMVDESPSAGLPESEYIELYNPGEKIIDLGGCRLILGSDSIFLPARNILPGEYRILCGPSDDFRTYGHPVEIPVFPAISNSGEEIRLMDPDAGWIFFLELKPSWFPGGWKNGISIEMIDTGNPCGQSINWGFSKSRLGGTPGLINSIAAPNPDLKNPQLESVSAADSLTLIFAFSEFMQMANAHSSDLLIGDDLQWNGFRFEDPGKLIGILDRPLAKNATYLVKVSNLTDCAGNLVREGAEVTSMKFFLIRSPAELISWRYTIARPNLLTSDG